MKNFIKSVLILCTCLFGFTASAQSKWATYTNSCFNFYYTIPTNYVEIIEHVSNDGYTFRYNDGIEIYAIGFYADPSSDITLWDFYLSDLKRNPAFYKYNEDWYVTSFDHGDGTESYTRAGSYWTSVYGDPELSEVIAILTISYPKTAKKRAQQIIQKCFKGFPQHF